jgi:hypothetical protein
MNVRTEQLDLDASIQCRASIDTATVNEYAIAMSGGDKFPPVELFAGAGENDGRYWIGDGWHRVLAAIQLGRPTIQANVSPGGRLAALKCALGANAVHGQRRTNADKRRCVEIALREFPKLSSRAIAELCGVSHTFVDGARPLATVATCPSRCTGQDGKEYPARTKKEREQKDGAGMVTAVEPRPVVEMYPESGAEGMYFAQLAIAQLGRIQREDPERKQAFACVRRWIDEQEQA